MPAKKGKQPAPGKWKYTIGEPPMQLTAYERADRSNRIYTRVWDGSAYRDKLPLLNGGIRDAAGRIDPAKEIEAQAAALARLNEMRSGGAAAAPVKQVGPLTLAAGFETLLHPQKGKYAGGGDHVANITRASRIIVAKLGGNLHWADVRQKDYRALWRAMMNEHVRSGAYGLRWIEVVCEALASAARWLQQEGDIEPGDGEPARGWKTALRKEWQEITKRPAAEAKKPRYTEAESARLFAALPDADPRIRLAVEIGAELRLGQVVTRTKRSDIHPSPDGAEPLWAVQVHGKGKKKGEYVVLTETQRMVLRRMLDVGYLADLEDARARGEITDYYLIPGRLSQTFTTLEDGTTTKRARIGSAKIPLGKTGLAKRFRELERLARVAHQAGRLWYGLRRRQADEADKEDVAPGVKNRLGGWTKTSTREGYLEAGRMEDAVAAADVRKRIRRGDG
jgi:hypothetical protein